MTSLLGIRDELIKLLILKDSEKKLNWEYSKNDASARTDFGDFSIHIDRKTDFSASSFKVWVFSNSKDGADLADVFDITRAQKGEKAEGLSAQFAGLSAIYERVREQDEVSRVAPALDMLKSL